MCCARSSQLLLITGVLIGCEQAGSAPGPRLAGTDMSMSGGVSGASLNGSGGMSSMSGAGAVPSMSGAGAVPSAGGVGGVGSGGSGGGATPDVDAGPPVDESLELYADDSLPRFDITLPEASIAMLRADGETYVPGELRYGDEVVSNIGVRIKGEGSLRSLDEKAAFKLKLDEFVPLQTFRGLRRMTLNNMVEDPSFLAERLAYEVFRAAGLPAPRCNSALVYVNDELFGVYANIETEDKTFLRRWFTDEDGNLYEEGQVDFEAGAEQLFDLETNEQENDRSDLRRLIDVFEASSASTFLTEMGAVLDMPHFLRFTAAEAAVNQWDMYGYTVFFPNNFRLYHDPTSDKFVFLPWGMDMSMKPYRDSGRPHIAIYELARMYDGPFSQVTAGQLFQRCLESAECRAQYSTTLSEVVTVYESLELQAKAERFYEQIKPHVLADPRKEYSEAEFEEGYDKLLSTIRERPDAIRAELE